MDKLDQILSITDTKERQKVLSEYALKLKISPAKAKNEKGEIDENKLTVFIFEAREARNKSKSQKVIILVIAAVFFVLCTWGMYVVMRMFISG